jgi:hypothetical protein
MIAVFAMYVASIAVPNCPSTYHSQSFYRGAQSNAYEGLCEYRYTKIFECTWCCGGDCHVGCASGSCGPSNFDSLTPPIDCNIESWCECSHEFGHTCIERENVAYVGASQTTKLCVIVPCSCLNKRWTPPLERRFAPIVVKTTDSAKTTKLVPANTSPTSDPVHNYGDILCYQFIASKADDVTAVLKTSTYEGRCMNYPVGPAEPDTISDMVPDTVTEMSRNRWRLLAHWYEDDRSCFKIQRMISAGVTNLQIRVLDYAAEGDLSAWDSSGHEIPDPQQIPPDYERFKSTGDADSDGFTAWEEYRGFMDDYGQHWRLDSLQTDVYVYNHAAAISQENLNRAAYVVSLEVPFPNSFRMDWCPTEQGVYDDPRILDFKSHKLFYSSWLGGIEVDNPLCYPGYDASAVSPHGGHQGYIHLYDGEGPGLPEAGICLRDSAFPEPGGIGVLKIGVWTTPIWDWVIVRQGLPPAERPTVYDLVVQRFLNHELGHAFSLPHTPTDFPENGDFRCAMSYILSANDSTTSIYNRIPTTWETYAGQIGWEYWIDHVGNKDTYSYCNGEVRFRP